MKTKRLAMTGLVVGLLLALSSDALAFYNPSAGKWLSRDPIGERGGMNLYGFVGNDPDDRVDLFGQLGYKTMQAPKPAECGGVDPWTIIWQLEQNAAKGGYVIQHIAWQKSVTDCDGKSIRDPNLDFYEILGYIPQNKTATGSSVDDTWGVQSRGPGTQGTITITGTGTFYDNGNTSWPPGFSAGQGPGDGAGQGPWGYAPYSFTAPSWPGSGSISRSLTVTWHCCCPWRFDSHISYQ
jgi:hypothetical protein